MSHLNVHSHSAKEHGILGHSCEVIKAGFGGSAFERHFHDTFSIGLVTSGMNTFTYRGKYVEVPTGTICIADPGEVHDGGLAGLPWSYANIFVPMDLFQKLSCEEDKQTQIAFPRNGVSDRETCLRLSHLLGAVFANETDKARIDELAIVFFRNLLTRHSVDAKTTRPRFTREPVARRAIEIMTDHKGMGVSLAQLSRDTGVSRYSVIRAVSAALGITPVAYMIQLRIERAKRLIWSGVPIAQAAAEAGFSDQSHLTREMKRRMGITPGKLKT